MTGIASYSTSTISVPRIKCWGRCGVGEIMIKTAIMVSSVIPFYSSFAFSFAFYSSSYLSSSFYCYPSCYDLNPHSMIELSYRLDLRYYYTVWICY
jgi:hypothetical protein